MLPKILFHKRTRHHASDICQTLGDVSALFLWRTNDPAFTEPSVESEIRRLKSSGLCFDIDRDNTRMEGSFFLWAGLNVFGDADQLAEENRSRFEEFLKRVGHQKKAYVFGTGPSLSSFAAQHDFSDGISLASNSMVKNEALLSRLAPAAIVAADPIFHAGCSRYAEAFRNQLAVAMRAHDAHFVTSLRDYSMFSSSLPRDLRERIIGVPFCNSEDYNPDLSSAFFVKPVANILTLLLLPLGAAVADEICIVGCDGRPLDKNQYFWGHDKAVQFNEEMDNIKEVHPAFFKVNYDDYYAEHCANVEAALSALEKIGKTISVLTPSHIPALSKRYSPPPQHSPRKPEDDAVGPGRPVPRLIALDPDGLNRSGHFFSHDIRLFEAAKSANIAFTLFARVDCNSQALPPQMQVIKCLTAHSWEIARRSDAERAVKAKQFAAEISGALKAVASGSETVQLYMYCGSLEHASAIAAVLDLHPSVHAHVTLFWQFSATYSAAFVSHWHPVIVELMSQQRLTLDVPTEGIRADLRTHFGINLPVAPHPSTTFSDEEALRISEQTPHKTTGSLTVLFPGGARSEKGAALTAAVVEKLSAERMLDVVVRASRDHSDPESLRCLENLSGDGVAISRDSLTDEEFKQFLNRGDIIVCPYLESAFARRTSGLVTDAMILGRPVVALKNTWLGEFVEREGFGVAADSTGKSITNAIMSIADQHEEFCARAALARKRYLRDNAWAGLVTSVIANGTQDGIGAISRRSKAWLSERPRSARAHVDETAVVARLSADKIGGAHVMVDVGAHYGTSASYFHKLGWRIYCFEPDERNREKLSARYQGVPSVHVDSRAVAEQCKTAVPFFASPESSGVSSLGRFLDSHHEATRVDVTTVAEIADEYALKHIDFLKVDVEGFDFAVLKGVPWRDLHPSVIECEFEDAKTQSLGHKWRDIAAFLESRGYAVYISEWHPIIRYGIRHEWRRVVPLQEADLAPKSWGNILAFKLDPGFAAVQEAFCKELRTHPPAQPPSELAPVPPNSDLPGTPAATQVLSALASGPAERPLATSKPTAKLRFYAAFAESLRQGAPRLFALARFAKQATSSLWRRRTFFVPLALALAVWLLAGFAPALTSWRWHIWGSATLFSLLTGLIYVAFRMRQFVEHSLAEMAALRGSLATANRQIEQLRKTDHRLASEDSKLAKTLAGVRSRIAQASDRTAQSSDMYEALETRLSQTEALATGLRASLTEARKTLDALTAESKASMQQQADAAAAIKDALESRTNALQRSLSEGNAEATQQISAARRETQELKTEVAAQATRLAHTDRYVVFNNAARYQRFNRRLNDEHVEVLKRWVAGTPAKATSQAIGYAAHRACQVEARMQGRLATTVEDILLRTLAAMSVPRASLNVLEIGSLFGISAGIMYDLMAPHYDNLHFTLIDPLDGYYESDQLDVLTGQPISERTLRENLSGVNLSGDRLALIKLLSTDEEAINLARQRQYDVLVIDGDHTFDGVKADFELYMPMVRRGGIIIFDDYDQPDWPDVKRFVDVQVEPMDIVRRVGHEWRTCVYRKVRTSAKQARSYAQDE
ncbi:MAG: FkbM family methyltransferase [Hyphomonadaceae bacterium]